jgi:hypothetical protein
MNYFLSPEVSLDTCRQSVSLWVGQWCDRYPVGSPHHSTPYRSTTCLSYHRININQFTAGNFYIGLAKAQHTVDGKNSLSRCQKKKIPVPYDIPVLWTDVKFLFLIKINKWWETGLYTGTDAALDPGRKHKIMRLRHLGILGLGL